MTVELAFIAEVSLRVAVPATDLEDARIQAAAAARNAVKTALAQDTLPIARVLRDALEPISHTARIYLVIGDDAELLVSIRPEEQGADHAGS